MSSVEVAIVSNVGNVQLRRLVLFVGAIIVERANFRNYPPVLGKVVNITAFNGKQCEILQFKYFNLENLVLNTVQKLSNCSKPEEKWFVAMNTTLQYQYTTNIGDGCHCTNTAILFGLTSPEPASRLVQSCALELIGHQYGEKYILTLGCDKKIGTLTTLLKGGHGQLLIIHPPPQKKKTKHQDKETKTKMC